MKVYWHSLFNFKEAPRFEFSLHRPPGPSEPSVILGFFRKFKNYQKFSVVVLARILMILKKKRKLVYLSIEKDKRPQENVVK